MEVTAIHMEAVKMVIQLLLLVGRGVVGLIAILLVPPTVGGVEAVPQDTEVDMVAQVEMVEELEGLRLQDLLGLLLDQAEAEAVLLLLDQAAVA
jgi:hypothetical protein